MHSKTIEGMQPAPMTARTLSAVSSLSQLVSMRRVRSKPKSRACCRRFSSRSVMQMGWHPAALAHNAMLRPMGPAPAMTTGCPR